MFSNEYDNTRPSLESILIPQHIEKTLDRDYAQGNAFFIIMVVLGAREILNLENLINLRKVKKLKISNNNIQDISFMNNMIDLTELRIYSQSLRDISVINQLENIEKLILSCNFLQDLSPVSNLFIADNKAFTSITLLVGFPVI